MRSKRGPPILGSKCGGWSFGEAHRTSSAIAKHAEALTMPLDDSSRFDQHHHLQTTWPHTVEPDPNQTIDCPEAGAVRPLAAQDCELMAKRYHFELQL